MSTNPLALKDVSAPLRFIINRVSALDVLSNWYEEWLQVQEEDVSQFLDFALARVGAEFAPQNIEALALIPRDKALLIVANHPLGALEGMLLSRLLLRYRPDLKVLTNEMLMKFKEFRELFIGVDVLNPNKQQMNARGMLQASRHLAGGGALLIFPAGTVSVLDLRSWSIQDAPWKDIVGRLALRYDAYCLPIHVEGRNSWPFYLSGLIHKRLRTMLLPRAMLGQRGKVLSARIGQVFRLRDTHIDSASAATDYLRLSCELLACKHADSTAPRHQTLHAGMERSTLDAAIADMQAYKVADKGGLSVYCAPYHALGPMAQQLALVRERTFRTVGEGTGLALDADRYDPHYWHIIAWDQRCGEIVGAYRAARVDSILQQQGVVGLYSNSLFHYDERFLHALGGAIEVGRSFVTEPYQSNPHALDLLWQGLGAFVLRNPDCHTLFGCVSISSRFAPMIRALLSDSFLASHSVSATMRTLVRPVSPFRYERRFWTQETVDAISNTVVINKLLGNAGPTHRIPVLIRHYLALNGKFIDFSINHGFSKALDGLITVDLRTAPERYLRRYLGAQGSVKFLQRWKEAA